MSDAPTTSLSTAAIAAALGPLAVRFDVDVLAACESTNSELMRRAESGAASGTAIVAESQTAGRGRMGRSWFAAPGASLTFSLLWRFAPRTVPYGLSLAVGVALAEALAAVGVDDVRLKWPNDVLRDGRKLAGVLVELAPGAPNVAVIGIGLNLRLPPDMPDDVKALAAAADTSIVPEELLARLLASLHGVLTEFAAHGFYAVRDRWLALCAHLDMPVQILSEFAPPLSGRCVGIDVDGALMIETAVCVQRVLSGDVSLRAV